MTVYVTHALVTKLLTCVYIGIFSIGILANCMIIFVVWKNKYMKNAANFLLISLSTSDLMIILFCLPVPLYELYFSDWIFGSFVCKFSEYLQYVSVTSSILTILAIGVERQFVIKYPLKAKVYFTKRNTILILTFVWTLSSVNSIPAVLFSNLDEVNSTSSNSTQCKNDVFGYEWYIITEIIVFYAIPGCTICAIYANIIHSLRRYSLEGVMFHSANRSRSKQQLQLTLVLGAVIVVYFVCLLPFNVLVLLAVFWPKLLVDMNYVDYTIFLSISRLLFFVNSCINPIFYGFLSTKFRTAVVEIFSSKSRLRRRNAVDSDVAARMSRDASLLSVLRTKHRASMDATFRRPCDKLLAKRYSIV